MTAGALLGPRVFLFASNVRAKYFEDCLKALMLPRGLVLHFRYRRDWIQPELQTQIETQQIVKREVAICFLKQRVSGPNAFEAVLNRPLRSGHIVDAFFRGPSAHIYFAVTGYPIASELHVIAEAADAARAKHADRPAGRPFVVETDGLWRNQFTTDVTDDDSAFAGVVDSFQEDDLEVISDDGTRMVAVDPLFWRIDGLHTRSNWWDTKAGPITMDPTPIAAFTASQRNTGYVVTRDIPIETRVQFYQPAFSRLHTAGMDIVATTDSKHFSNPEEDRIPIQSGYDEGSFVLLPVRTDRAWLSRISICPMLNDTYSPVRRPVFASFEAWVDARPAVSSVSRVISAVGTNLATMSLAIASLVVSVVAKASPNAPLPSWAIPVLVILTMGALGVLVWNALVKIRVGE